MKRSALIILFITIFIDLLGFGLVLPFLPIYIKHFGGAPWVCGALMASFSLMQFIFSPIWGRMSDRVGRRPMILLSLIGSAISFTAFGMARSLIVLFTARVAAGILSAASLPTAQAYIADVTPPDKRAGGMAIIGAAFGLGFAFGPVVGAQLSQHPVLGISPIAMPAYFAALMCLGNFIWAFFMLPETHHERNSEMEQRGILDVFPTINRALADPVVGKQLTVFGFATFAFAAVESTFSWLILLRFDRLIHERAAEHWAALHRTGQTFAQLPPETQRDLVEKAATAATGTIFAIVGITVLLTQGAVMGGLARRIGEHRLVMFGAGTLTVSLLLIAIAPTLLQIELLSALIALGNGVMNPSLSALITHAAGPKERGAISGAQQGLGSLARIIAPPINNTLVSVKLPGNAFPSGIPFFLSAVVMSVAFMLSLKLKPLPSGASVRGAHGAPAPATEG